MAIVLVVGKSNVGKSTLFNKLIGKRKSIVADEERVTRDVVVDHVHFNNKSFELVDTCGIFSPKQGELSEEEETIYKKSVENTIRMLKEADLILFVVDGRNGISSEDIELGEILRESGVDVLLVANKIENEKVIQKNLDDIYSLGFGEPFIVSAEHSISLDELLEETIRRLEEKGLDLQPKSVESLIRVSLIGKPNAGKSSLFNMIINEERALVTPIPGTTRDTVDKIVRIGDREYLFVDTAGLRRKSNVEDFLERVSVSRTLDALERSDVAVAVIDASQGITKQDQKIIGLAENRGKGIVVVLNKVDLIDRKKREILIEKVKEELYFVDFAQVIFTSAKERIGYKELMKAIRESYESLNRRVPTSAVNAALERLIAKPPHGLRIYYGMQVDVRPPVFLFFTNGVKVPESFQQTLRRMVRHHVDPFVGAPVFVRFKERS